ncbi:MAG TPA: glycosyltransferase [Chloroflexota bacterium]|nr:glycosyltransferase [Chloroflexota bacterium]
MRFALFCHSLRSDWNNGHAHFLRGLMRALISMGHEAIGYEEAGSWSVSHLVAEHGWRPLLEFRRQFPLLRVRLYDSASGQALRHHLRRELAGMDVVILHEWVAVERPDMMRLLLELKRECGYTLLFHDTHYRILTQPVRLARLRLERCDGVLAFSSSIAAEYRRRLGLDPVYVFHEAADDELFQPVPADWMRPLDDVTFVGNWGGRDRAAELREFLLRPARANKGRRRFAIYGVRYPPRVLDLISRYYGADYRGWLPNYRVPQVFAQSRVVVHIARRQYARVLHGTPTIRPFEALACGAALVSTPWPDTDGLFRAGHDYVVVASERQMVEALEWLWQDEVARRRLGQRGAARIRAQHTCRHRAEQLLGIVAQLRGREEAGRLPAAVALPQLQTVLAEAAGT